MQTATSLFSGLSSGGGGGGEMMSGPIAGMAGGGAMAGAQSSGSWMTSPQSLSDIRMGTSAISALSSYAMSRSQQGALNLEAGDETIAARQDFTQAQQKTNLINRQFYQVQGRQLADAAAGGIDIGSGSVQQQTLQAEQERNRQVGVQQTQAQMDAAQRMSRATFLRYSASTTGATGVMSSLADLGRGFLQYSQVGG